MENEKQIISQNNDERSSVGQHCYADKNIAFTLAEVLITLGIIGVVAALTLPTLITNNRAKQYKSQFKKTLSILNQAGKLAEARYDFSYSDIESPDTDYYWSIDDNPESKKSMTALFNGTLKGKWDTSPSMVDPIYGYDMARYNYFSDFSNGLGSSSGFIFQTVDTANIIISNYCYDNYCLGYIDVDGYNKGKNAETKCSSTDTKRVYTTNDETGEISWDRTRCEVKNKDVNDIFPIIFHDNMVEPATNAGVAAMLD